MIDATAGRLRQRLSLRRPTKSQDAYGGPTATYAEYANCWGEVTPIGSMERMAAEIVNPLVTHAVTVRHRTDMRPDDLIVYQGRTFEITGITDMDERRRYLRVQCIEKV